MNDIAESATTFETRSYGSQPYAELFVESAYFDGEWSGASNGASIEVLNPATTKVIGEVPLLTPSDVNRAISAGSASFKKWRETLVTERSAILRAWGDLLLEKKQTLASLVTAEQGKPISESIGEVEYAAGFLHWFAEECKRNYGDTIPSHLENCKLTVQRVPVGVVVAITPWNFPIAMLVRKAAAAIAAGCSVIGYPSIETPFSALATAKLAREAGVPDAVFSVLTGNSREIVPQLCANPLVRAVSFTGSTHVGSIIAEYCAPTIKRVSLELGGHAPFIVFPDADLDAAVCGAMAAKFATSGQDCLAANRIFVHSSIHDNFVELLTRKIRGLVTCKGDQPGCQIGPMINKSALSKLEEQIKDAVSNGAKLVVGGEAISTEGAFFEPTLLTGVTSAMKIANEETFGPIAAIIPFDDEAEVLALANATEYGLMAYVYTRDHARTIRVSDELEYGMVAINTPKVTGPPIPFGGVKQSGLGREGSKYGMDEYTELKYVCAAY